MTVLDQADAPPRVGARVRYRERQRVRAADLRAEQDHRVQARRRHDRGQHVWGVAAGLALVPTAAGLEVQPGVAVDGYGRTLVLRATIAITWEQLDRFRGGAAAVDLWLMHGTAARTPPRAGFVECDESRAGRIVDRPRLRLSTAASVGEDPHARAPRQVPLADLTSGAAFTPLELGEWPVYLGRLVPAGGLFTIVTVDRPQAGLVGESIDGPAGDVRLQVGGELPGDLNRLAVEVVAGLERTRVIAVDRQGSVRIRGATRVLGKVLLAVQHRAPGRGGADPCASFATAAPSADLPSAVGFRPRPAPTAASPWQLYRTRAGDPPSDGLRIEIAHPGTKGDPASRKLRIGWADANGAFTSCLAVAANCSVTVKPGSVRLAPGHQLVRAPALGSDLQDPRVAVAIVAAWLDMIGRAGVKLDDIYVGSLTLAIQPGATGAGSYTVTVTNPGPALVRDVSVEDLSTNPAGGGPVLSGETLEPGTSRSVVRQLSGPRTPETRVSATATGTGPPGYPVNATASPMPLP